MVSSDLAGMRKAAKSLSESVLTKHGDRIEGIIIEGSVARGDIHEASDIDMVVFLDPSKWPSNQTPQKETLTWEGWQADIEYELLDTILDELENLYGSDWEMASSAIGEALILFDKNGKLKQVKKQNQSYPKAIQKRNVTYLWEKILDLSEAVWVSWQKEDYNQVCIYSRMVAERFLRILFPLSGKKARADKKLIDEAPLLVDKQIAEKIQMILTQELSNPPTRTQAQDMINGVEFIRNRLEKQIDKNNL